jgi:hypothetical protein
MDKLKTAKIIDEINNFNEEVPIGCEAANVDLPTGDTLLDFIGDWNIKEKGSIASYIEQLEERISALEQ